MSDSTLEFAQAAKAGREVVGGKAQTLGQLSEAGFRVPPGFVIPTGNGHVADPDIRRALSALGPGPFAVRSSGVSEDGAETSLAGMYRTYLHVDEADVYDAVADVRENGQAGNTGDDIAVIVQRMVDPVCAGVAFTADPVTGDRGTTIVNATVGTADNLVSGEVAGDEWRVVGGKAKPRRRPEGVLDRRLAARVARKAGEIAHQFGSPQDVEWAWDGKQLWVVQARPITGLPAEVSWETEAAGVFNRGFRFGEWIPEPVTPLFETWLLTAMEKRVHQLHCEQIGQVAPKPLHVIVNGWYFYSLNFLPVPGGSLRRSFPGLVRNLFADPRRMAVMFPQTVRFGYRLYEDDWRNELGPRYRKVVGEAAASVESVSPDGLIELIDRLADLAGEHFASVTVVAGSAYKTEGNLAQFWRRNLKTSGDSHMALLQGLQPPGELSGGPRIESLDWYRKPIEPNPGAGSPDSDGLRAKRLQAERAATAALAGSPRKQTRFRRLLEDAQHLVPVREQQLAEFTLPWPVLHRAVVRLGEHLAARGSVAEVEDVFFLERSELESLLAQPLSMHSTVSGRRTRWIESSRLSPPLSIGKVPAFIRLMFSMTSSIVGADRSDRAILHGVPASPGRATGPVRVVRNSSDFESVEEGDVLVAPLTAPAWADLFLLASAVVTDVGSAFAHASIIAREYGIPAVVGCGDATSRLSDGDMVRVDGSRGIVEPASSTF